MLKDLRSSIKNLKATVTWGFFCLQGFVNFWEGQFFMGKKKLIYEYRLSEILEVFKYNYPYDYSAMTFFYTVKDKIKELILFVEDTLLNAPNEKHQLILNKIIRKLDDELQGGEVGIERIENWLDKYNLSLDQLLSNSVECYKNKVNGKSLLSVLQKEPVPESDPRYDEYSKNYFSCQSDFYAYWYSEALKKAIDEIENFKAPTLVKNLNSL